MRRLLPLAITSLFLVAAASAQAAPSVSGIFDLPEEAKYMALGHDGNIWVTLNSSDPNFAKVTPDGTVTPVTVPDLTFPGGITAGPGGKMWVTGTNYVGQFTPSNPGDAIKTNTAEIGSQNEITTGPDGNLWTGSDAKVVRITPTTTPTITGFPTGIGGFSARGIAAGGDGRLWIANAGTTPGILPMATDGTPGTIAASSDPIAKVMDVAAGPGTQLAYTQPVGDVQQIGLINGGAIATTTPTPLKDPTGITLGQDGAYWMAQFNSPSIGRYTTDGQYSEITGVPVGGRRIAKGTGNTIWVLFDLATKKIARITGVENPDVDPPVITKAKLTNTKFKVGTKKTPSVAAKKKKTPTGTTLSYTLSENATATIEIQKAVSGRKSGKACVKPTTKLKKAKKCTRYVKVKTLTRLQLAGPNKVAFSGRIGSTKLKPGKYRFSITGTDAKGNASEAPVTKSFTIVQR